MRAWLEQYATVLTRAIAKFEPRSRSVQLGRTLIAVSQILTLTLTPWERLTPQIVNTPQAPVCEGVARAGLFCLAPADHPGVALTIAVVVLIAVCAGIFPRVTGVLHAWISFSIAVSLGLPDGGEQVAQVVTILLAVLTVADERVFAWRTSTRPVTPTAQGVAFAAWWLIRLQMAGIYLQSGIAKLGVEDWLNGSAMYYIVRDGSFGSAGPIGHVMQAVTATPIGVAALTWGTIVGEIALAVLLLLGPRSRRLALIISVLLHVGIIAVIGLWSFALIMIGAVCTAANLNRLGEGPQRPSDAELAQEATSSTATAGPEDARQADQVAHAN